MIPQFGHDRCLTNPLQFIIHCSDIEILGGLSHLLLEILEWHLSLDTTISLQIRYNSLSIHCSQTEVLGGFSQLLLEILELHLNLDMTVSLQMRSSSLFIIPCSHTEILGGFLTYSQVILFLDGCEKG